MSALCGVGSLHTLRLLGSTAELFINLLQLAHPLQIMVSLPPHRLQLTHGLIPLLMRLLHNVPPYLVPLFFNLLIRLDNSVLFLAFSTLLKQVYSIRVKCRGSRTGASWRLLRDIFLALLKRPVKPRRRPFLFVRWWIFVAACSSCFAAEFL